MNRAAILSSLLILATPAAAQLAPYWVPDAGCTINFLVDGNPLTATAAAPMDYTQSAAGNWSTFAYAFDDDGDVCLREHRWFSTAEPQQYPVRTYDPPAKVLDYPLTAGKTWQSDTTEIRDDEYHVERPLTISASVIGPDVVATGLGDLDVVVVHIDYQYTDGYGGDWSKTYYLHDQLGPVQDLVSITGCDLVPTESITWGAIKALAE